MKRKNDLSVTSQPEKKIKIEDVSAVFKATVTDLLDTIDAYKQGHEYHSLYLKVSEELSALDQDKLIKFRIVNHLRPIFLAEKVPLPLARACFLWSAKYDDTQLINTMLGQQLRPDSDTLTKAFEVAFENNCTNTKALLCNLDDSLIQGIRLDSFIKKAIASSDLESIVYILKTPLAAIFPDRVTLLDLAQSKSKKIARVLEEEIRADFRQVSQDWDVEVIPFEITSGWIEHYKKVISYVGADNTSFNYSSLTQDPLVLFIANDDLKVLKKLIDNKKINHLPDSIVQFALCFAEERNDCKTLLFLLENIPVRDALTSFVCDMFDGRIKTTTYNSLDLYREIFMHPSLDWERVISVIRSQYMRRDLINVFYDAIPRLAQDNCILFNEIKYVQATVKMFETGYQKLAILLLTKMRQNDSLNKAKYSTILLSTIVSFCNKYNLESNSQQYYWFGSLLNLQTLNEVFDLVQDLILHIDPVEIKNAKKFLYKDILPFKNSNNSHKKELWEALKSLIEKYQNRMILHKYMLFCHSNELVNTPTDVKDLLKKQYVEETLPDYTLPKSATQLT